MKAEAKKKAEVSPGKTAEKTTEKPGFFKKLFGKISDSFKKLFGGKKDADINGEAKKTQTQTS